MEGGLPDLLAAAVRPPGTSLTSTNYLSDTEGTSSGAVGAGAHPGTPDSTCCHRPGSKQTPHTKPGASTVSNHTRRALTH